MAEVDEVAGAPRYTDNHSNTQSYHLRKYVMRGGWGFRRRLGFSQWFKKEFQTYPPREVLVELAKVSGAEREGHVWLGLYLREKKHLVGKSLLVD